MAAKRSPWLNDRAALLVRLLAEEHQLTITEEVAREDVSDHLDYVAAMMRIGRQAAKMYVTDEVIKSMADRIGEAVRANPGIGDRLPPSPRLRIVK